MRDDFSSGSTMTWQGWRRYAELGYAAGGLAPGMSYVNYERQRELLIAAAPTCVCGDRGTHRPEPGIGCTRPGCLCLEPADPQPTALFY